MEADFRTERFVSTHTLDVGLQSSTRIVCVDPRTSPLWERLIGCDDSTVFHSPAWMRVLAKTYGFEATALILMDPADVPVAGCASCRIQDLVGERIVSLPFSDYCDPLVRDSDDWNSVFGAFLNEGCPVVFRCLHKEPPLQDKRLVLFKRARWHSKDLRLDLENLWAGLTEETRRAIRKAQRSGIVIRPARDRSELRSFFDLHLGIRKKKYRLLAQPYSFFENIWLEFIEHGTGTLLLAFQDASVIGGVLFLRWKDTLYYKFNASSPSALGCRPNDLLIWEGIQHAKATGCDLLDFGLSDWDQEGLLRFKRKFATEEKTISFLRYSPVPPARHEAHARALLAQLTAVLTEDATPESVTDRAGEILYRYFA